MKKAVQSKKIQSVVGLLVSLALILWVMKEIDWKQAWEASVNMHTWVLLPIIATLIAHYYLRAWRWRYLLADGDAMSVQLLFDASMIGNLATYLLPLRAGEFIRPFVLYKESPVPVSYPAAFTSVVIERFFDLAVVLATFALVLFYIPEVPEWAHAGAYGLSLLGAGILVFIVAGILIPKQLLGLMELCLSPFPAGVSSFFVKTAEEFVSGAHVLKSPRKLLMTVLLSLLVWISNYFLFYIAFWMLDIPGSMLMATTSAVIVALAVAAPSAPGFVGVIQVACIASFAIFGVSKELGAAYSIILHIVQYLVVCGTGFYGLTKRNLSLSKLNHSREAPAQA